MLSNQSVPEGASCLLLCRAAATAEIKRAYKKLALAYHPDKHKAEDAEQQAGYRQRVGGRLGHAQMGRHTVRY